MTEGLAAVQARVAHLQSLVGSRASAGTRPGAAGSAAFGGALVEALGRAETLALAQGTPAGSTAGNTAGSPSGTSGATGWPSGASAALAAGGAGATRRTGGDAGGGASSAAVGARALELARTYTGVPYRWGGTDPRSGLDCSGLVQLVYKQLGVSLPRVSADQARAGTKVPSLAQARPGDLVFFGSPVGHVGIYAGDGKMIDAPRAGKTVGLHPLWSTPVAIRRVAPSATVDLAAAAPVATRGASGAGGGLRGPYAELFTAAGRRHGIDPALLSAIAKTESSYDPSAVSPAGARGLMQLMPGTARSLGVNAFDPTQAVDGAARLVSQLLRQFDGKVDLALAGYNAGPGAVRRYGGVPPYTETQNYVERVTRSWKALS